MTQSTIPQTSLPALAPDLLLQRRSGLWLIQDVSQRLATVCQTTAALMQGRQFLTLFPAVSPELTRLLDEVVESHRDLLEVRVRLRPELDSLLANFHYLGPDENFQAPQVQVSFRAETIASQSGAGYAGLIGRSPAMREVFRKIELYANTDAAVVVTGETGVGKELVAKALHHQGTRRQGPFTALNCSAISEQLLESELFGHEKGAFTGAHRAHRGHFEQADGGTLFLDEVGDMPLALQGKLLRALEDGRIQPVGSEQSRWVDVRIVAATNVPLERAVRDRRFRADLYHRLAVLRIHVPALRERSEDIPLFANHFLQLFNRRYAKEIERLTPEALSVLSAYLWPGNIRELRNLIERLVIETQAAAIGGQALAEWVRERQSFQPGELKIAKRRFAPIDSTFESPAAPAIIDAELVNESQSINRARLTAAYRQAGGNIAAASRLLNIHRATFYRHLQRLGLKRSDLQS